MVTCIWSHALIVKLDSGAPSRWDQLSPGEQKRWQVGAALASSPDLRLLDEPTIVAALLASGPAAAGPDRISYLPQRLDAAAT